MSTTHPVNRVRDLRLQRGWSQAQLAERTGISRAAVSAIEGQRLVPSVAVALALAGVFGVTVEALFGQTPITPLESNWAWKPPRRPWRYWQAEVNGRVQLYPVERTGEANPSHDGVADVDELPPIPIKAAVETLVLASCDPAVGILAREYQRQTGLRMIVLIRSSRDALELLRQGRVHVAGVHFAHANDGERNEHIVGAHLGGGIGLLRAAEWQEGIAYCGSAARSIRGLLNSHRQWIGREVGSAARACLDQLLPKDKGVKHVAEDHRGVAAAIKSGWADAGVCVQLVSDDAGLQFLTVQQESYDLCFRQSFEQDRRLQSLVLLIQSTAFRALIGDLPGYDTRHSGEMRHLSSNINSQRKLQPELNTGISGKSGTCKAAETDS